MNRNTYQITEDILDNIMLSGPAGISITPLIRHSNISHGRIGRLIDKLTQNSLINEIVVHDKKTFVITERGKMFLAEYKKFNIIAESFGLEL
jgi:predicted transcriptional regulator